MDESTKVNCYTTYTRVIGGIIDGDKVGGLKAMPLI